jgi:hypothetical protein
VAWGDATEYLRNATVYACSVIKLCGGGRSVILGSKLRTVRYFAMHDLTLKQLAGGEWKRLKLIVRSFPFNLRSYKDA